MSQMVPAVAGLSKAKIDAFAERLIGGLYPHLLRTPGRFPVFDYYEDELTRAYPYLKTGVANLQHNEEGKTWPDGRVLLSLETYEGAYLEKGRARFTVMHECFHGIQHVKQLRTASARSGAVPLFRRDALKPYEDPEWQANYFASTVLMPVKAMAILAAEYGGTLNPLEVGEVFGVSVEAARIRIADLTQRKLI